MHKHNCKSTHGFTLIELVLVMAITTIFVVIVFAVFSIVNTSHARVAVLNDAKDYAALNMQAIENLTADAIEVELLTVVPVSQAGCISVYFTKGATSKESVLWYIDDIGEHRAFDYGQYSINSDVRKWSILTLTTQPIFTTTSTQGVVHVNLQVVDNSTDKVCYTLSKDLIFLNIKSATSIKNPSGTVIKVKNFTPDI